MEVRGGSGRLCCLVVEALLQGFKVALVVCRGRFRGVGALSCSVEIGACVIEFGLELLGAVAVLGGLGG